MILVDTNVWLAAADRRSRDHDRCREALSRHRSDLASPVPVVAETAWLLLDRFGPDQQRRFLAMIPQGQVVVIDLVPADWARVLDLVERYADLRLDVVDASTVAVAERLGVTDIATLDERDFRTVRPAHCEASTCCREAVGQRVLPAVPVACEQDPTRTGERPRSRRPSGP